MGENPALNVAYLSYLRTVQEIHEKKQQLQKCISDGFFMMSKARYIMGVERVSKLHYSPDMKAKSMVYMKNDNDDNTVFDVKLATDSKQPVTNNSDSLRKRKKASLESIETPVETAVSDLKLSDDDEESDDTPDPLKWFGVLVPKALRDSQENFKKATVITGQICTLNEKLKFYEKSISQSQLKTSVDKIQ